MSSIDIAPTLAVVSIHIEAPWLASHLFMITLPNNNYPNPPDNCSNLILEPTKEIKFNPDYKANKPIFWHIFKELSKNNNGLVAHDKLQERLISAGKLYAGVTKGK